MGHGLTNADTMFSVRQKPWHGLGTVLEKYPESIDEALGLAGLDWEVEKVPVLYRAPGSPEIVEHPDKVVTVRTDNHDALGVVSKWYEIVQNREAFQFLSELIGSEVHFETAGSLHGGKRVWVLVKTPDYVEVGGDAVETYVFVSTSHNGQHAVKAAVSPIRIVCQNTLTAAMNRAQRTYTVQHQGNPSRELAEARKVLDITIDYSKQFKEWGDRLASERMTDQKMKAVLSKLYPVEDGMGDRAIQGVEATRQTIQQIFREGETRGNAPGTKWSGLNAICEYVDWGASDSRVGLDGRMTRTLEDSTGLKSKAFSLVTA